MKSHLKQINIFLKKIKISKKQRIVFFILINIVLIFLYLSISFYQAEKGNTKMGSGDQSAYIEFSKEVYDSGFKYTGGRNRMPVYPYLQAFLYDSELSDTDFFTQGKKVNIILSLIVLILLFFIIRMYLPFLYSYIFILIIAVSIFIYKDATFQCELLFYFFNFCSFLLMNRMLIKPSVRLGVLTGLVLAVSHLTKASVLPGLILFILVSVAQIMYFFIKRRTQSDDYIKKWFPSLKNLIPIIFVCLTFLLSIYPYIKESKEKYGSYFYNVNSTFYFWYDSWDEAKEGTRAHGDRNGWPDLPKDEIPSFGRYIRSHNSIDISKRLFKGLSEILVVAERSFGYYKYFLASLIFVLLFIRIKFNHWLHFINKYPNVILFNAMYFVIYLLLYVWYVPIASGDRLFLAQFIPALFIFFIVLSKAKLSKQNKTLSRSFEEIMTVLILIDIALTIPFTFLLS